MTSRRKLLSLGAFLPAALTAAPVQAQAQEPKSEPEDAWLYRRSELTDEGVLRYGFAGTPTAPTGTCIGKVTLPPQPLVQ